MRMIKAIREQHGVHVFFHTAVRSAQPFHPSRASSTTSGRVRVRIPSGPRFTGEPRDDGSSCRRPCCCLPAPWSAGGSFCGLAICASASEEGLRRWFEGTRAVSERARTRRRRPVAHFAVLPVQAQPRSLPRSLSAARPPPRKSLSRSAVLREDGPRASSTFCDPATLAATLRACAHESSGSPRGSRNCLPPRARRSSPYRRRDGLRISGYVSWWRLLANASRRRVPRA